MKKIKVGIFLSHPIQYFSPIWRCLDKDPSLDLTVFYLSDSSIRGGYDPGFGRAVKWDLPLLEGYKSVFLNRNAEPSKRWSLHSGDIFSRLQNGKFQCVVILGYSRPFEWQVLRAAEKLDIGVVMRGEFAPSERTNPLKKAFRSALLKIIYKRVDSFAVIGKQASQHLKDHGVTPDRMFSSPYGVDSSLFGRRARSEFLSLRKKFDLHTKDRIVLFSGKLIPRKRPDTVIKAIAHLKDMPQVKTLLVGDGKLMDSLKKLADKIAPQKVIFAGFVNQTQLNGYFGLADALVLPSEYETWGLVINEAMHHGLPVFSSDKVGCAPNLVLPGVTGEIFPVGDSKTLAEELKRMWTVPGLQKSYSANSLRIIKDYTPLAAARGIHAAIVRALK